MKPALTSAGETDSVRTRRRKAPRCRRSPAASSGWPNSARSSASSGCLSSRSREGMAEGGATGWRESFMTRPSLSVRRTRGDQDGEASVALGLPEEWVTGSTPVALDPHEEVQRKAGQVVRHCFRGRVLLVIENFPVRAAGITALGTDRLGALRQIVIVNALARQAVTALDPHQVPFARAQGAMQITVALILRVGAHHAGDGKGAAHGTDATHGRLRGALHEGGDRAGMLLEQLDEAEPVDLQRCHQKRC